MPIRDLLLRYVKRFLEELPPSEGLMRLAISCLNLKSKAALLERMRSHPATRPSGESAAGDEKIDVFLDTYHLKTYFMNRLRGVAFDSMWRNLVMLLLRSYRSETSASGYAKKGWTARGSKIEEMWRRLRLTRVERELIVFLYCMKCYPSLEEFISESSRWNAAAAISVAIKSKPTIVHQAMNKYSRLVQIGFIEYHGENDGRTSETLGLSWSVVEFMSGIDWEATVSYYYAPDVRRTYEISSFPVSVHPTTVLQGLLRSSKPAHILIHGIPGTGKTEYARSLVGSVQKRVLIVKHGREGKLGERRLGLQLATAFADHESDVLIVDEADMILNTGYRLFGQQSEIDKGWLNDFLDASAAKIIWITNEISWMDESLLRRFAYSVRFPLPARSKREEIWRREIKAQGLSKRIPLSTIQHVASGFVLTPAAISSALSILRRLMNDKVLRDEDVLDTLEAILQTRQSLLGHAKAYTKTTVDKTYVQEALNTDQDLDGIVRIVSRHFGMEKRANGVNILFWGLPGTGKTEFARHLAERVGADLLEQKASDLLNWYLGGTEKNIRKAFEEAEQQRAVLLLDEADSFLRERKAARYSWELTQVNELLTSLERHRGVVICSTNLIDIFDRAALRRFAFKIQFKPLTTEGRLAVYRRYFPRCSRSLDEAEEDRLRQMPDLTLGDFKAVWTKLCFLREEPSENKTILCALNEECTYKAKNAAEIGFH